MNFVACWASAAECQKGVFIKKKIEIAHETVVKTRKCLIIKCLYQGHYVDNFSCSPVKMVLNYYYFFNTPFLFSVSILLLYHFTTTVFPKKIKPIEEVDNSKILPSLFEREKFKIQHRSYPRYKMLFWHLIRVIQTELHAKRFVLPMVGTIVYRTFPSTT